MFGGGDANAAEAAPAEHPNATDEEPADQGGGFFDSFGGDEEF